MLRKLILASIILTLVACAPAVPLQRADTANLSKGASASEVTRSVGKSTVVISHEFDANGKRYLANHYNLQTGTRTEMGMICSPTCIAYPIYIPILVPYVTIYEGEPKLLMAWGTLEELSRSPDESVSSIMSPLKASFEAEVAKKKK